MFSLGVSDADADSTIVLLAFLRGTWRGRANAHACTTHGPRTEEHAFFEIRMGVLSEELFALFM